MLREYTEEFLIYGRRYVKIDLKEGRVLGSLGDRVERGKEERGKESF